MASKQRWLSTLGYRDVVATMTAFEEINRCRIVIRIEATDLDGAYGPWLVGEIFGRKPESLGLVPWVCLKSRCLVTDWQSLDTAVFRMLYSLDGALAELELLGSTKKDAQLPAH